MCMVPETLTDRQKHIGSLTGIKAIALLLIFWWHSTIPKPSVDLGARTCEILFVASGFLIGYNYYFTNMPATWRASFEYSISKIIKFWPLHICGMLLVLLKDIVVNCELSGEDAIKALLNALLLQAWSPNQEVYLSYNGASWFLSALMFCYFMTPLLLKFSKKLKGSITLFIIIAIIRCLVEYIHVKYPDQFLSFHIHTFPLIRCMEFFMGMLIAPLFMWLRMRLNSKGFVFFSILELITTFLTVYLVFVKNAFWMRGIFVILFCFFVLVFSFDQGIVSKLLSSKIFAWFGAIQYEFYIIHSAVIICLNILYTIIVPDWRIVNILLFFTTIVCSIIYKKCFNQLFSSMTRNGIKKIISFFDLDVKL